ncbi:MAG: response regulator [Gemmataceae bacterium]|nr:response regulator [Gemmataceae bacterium]
MLRYAALDAELPPRIGERIASEIKEAGLTAVVDDESFHPCVCLIALDMPGQDGDELADNLRASVCDRPLVLVAVSAMSDDRSRGRTTGFRTKPARPPCYNTSTLPATDATGTSRLASALAGPLTRAPCAASHFRAAQSRDPGRR